MKFLKALAITVLVINSLGSAFLYPVVYLDFSLRRDYIAKVLCINRQKPITVCGGQCYLSDQLRKVRDQEEQDKENTASSIQFVFFYQPSHPIEFVALSVTEVKPGDGQTDEGTPVQFATDIFHPPSQA